MFSFLFNRRDSRNSLDVLTCCSACMRKTIKNKDPKKLRTVRTASTLSQRPTFKTAFKSTMKIRKVNKKIYEQNLH